MACVNTARTMARKCVVVPLLKIPTEEFLVSTFNSNMRNFFPFQTISANAILKSIYLSESNTDNSYDWSVIIFWIGIMSIAFMMPSIHVIM